MALRGINDCRTQAHGCSTLVCNKTMIQKVLITGVAGFIGFHVARRLLDGAVRVLGIDNFNSYYDPSLKEARVDLLRQDQNFSILRGDICDLVTLDRAWTSFAPDVVIHLAAQAGVRHSIENPNAYVESNLIGTFNILELSRRHRVSHLLAASSSSVYGANDKLPFYETDRTATPISLYAATKGAGELMGHAYAHLYQFPTTFFRFFTVYGPWGRPDMAYFKFTKAIIEGAPIDVFNNGDMERDFTFIDDLVESVVRLMNVVPKVGNSENGGQSNAPFRIVNIGQAAPIRLLEFIRSIESATGKGADVRFVPMQDGDVVATRASSDLLRSLTGFYPSTPVSIGIPKFVEWYKNYYQLVEQ